jgi:hypothetical protein
MFEVVKFYLKMIPAMVILFVRSPPGPLQIGTCLSTGLTSQNVTGVSRGPGSGRSHSMTQIASEPLFKSAKALHLKRGIGLPLPTGKRWGYGTFNPGLLS